MHGLSDPLLGSSFQGFRGSAYIVIFTCHSLIATSISMYNRLHLDVPPSTACAYIDVFRIACSHNANTGVEVEMF